MPVNFVTVIAAALVGFFIGFIWYSPGVFGSKWMKLSGIKKKDIEKAKKQGMAGHMVTAFVAQVVMSYVLALVIGFAGATTLSAGLLTGFWMWLGFLATTQLGSVLWERKPFELYTLNTVHWLVVVAVMGAILAAWG